MSILCYLKNEVHCIGYSPNGLQMLHPATRLSVGSDARGFHVAMSYDLFLEPFEIRPDLMRDIDWYSAKIEVDMPVYTNDAFQTGNYDCGDLLATLVISRKIVNHDGVLHREMTVRALDWECLKATIGKIRLGEITPVGREQTVLERAVAEVALARKQNLETVDTIASLRDELIFVRSRIGLLSTYAQDIRAEIFGDMYAPPSDEGHMLFMMLKTVRSLMSNTRELAAIKATRWHRFREFLSSLDITAPNS